MPLPERSWGSLLLRPTIHGFENGTMGPQHPDATFLSMREEIVRRQERAEPYRRGWQELGQVGANCHEYAERHSAFKLSDDEKVIIWAT